MHGYRSLEGTFLALPVLRRVAGRAVALIVGG